MQYLYATDGGDYGCLIPRDADFEVDGDHISFHGEDDDADMKSNRGDGDYDSGFYWTQMEIVPVCEAKKRGLVDGSVEPFEEYIRRKYTSNVETDTKYGFADVEVVNGNYLDMRSHMPFDGDDDVEIVYGGSGSRYDGSFYLGLADARDD
jgi:hypothetical protein